MEERITYNLGGCHEIEITDVGEEEKCAADMTCEGNVQEEGAVTSEALPQEECTESVSDPEGSEAAEANDTPEETDQEDPEILAPLMERIAAVDSGIRDVTESENRILAELKEIHKLYRNEYAGTLREVQRENEAYRKVESGRAFDGILESLAMIYVNYETLPDEAGNDTKLSKSIRYLLMDIEELLGEYGMKAVRSQPGDERSYRFCQVRNRIETGDKSLDKKVAHSYNTGFRIENRAVIKESVDVYCWNGTQDLNGENKYDACDPEADEAKPVDTAEIAEAAEQRRVETEMTQNEEVK